MQKTPIAPFNLSRLPRVEFGAGRIQKLVPIALSFGKNALIVSGQHSFTISDHWLRLQSEMQAANMTWQLVHVAEEPSPQLIDDTVRRLRGTLFDVVIGIGGGSALDAAKAVAGLLRTNHSVMDHLEGVGPELPYTGPSIPFIAVPTTAGTGSEATKNAVLSIHGAKGFKKSFRDERLVAKFAIIDPDLLATCSPQVIAANGMDAFTQLLESFVSTNANPITDALALSGLERIRDALLPWHAGTGDLATHRCNMAYGALLSGISLAQVGLGSVHGLAAPLGAFFPIPHGIACGSLVATATRINIQALQERETGSDALEKYAIVGRLLSQRAGLSHEAGLATLIETLETWTTELALPALSEYGVTEADIPRIVANSRGSSMKTNPIVLSDHEIAIILSERL